MKVISQISIAKVSGAPMMALQKSNCELDPLFSVISPLSSTVFSSVVFVLLTEGRSVAFRDQ
jgi:hypothetical protein